MSPAPPSHPRAARESQRLAGTWWQRSSDHTVWQIRTVTPRGVTLAPDFGGGPIVVSRAELERDWKQVGA